MNEPRADRVRGPGHDTFWDHCARGELRLQKCRACGHLTWPVEPACDKCGSADLTWERMSGRGKLVSWCEFHQDYYRGKPPVPYGSILVELDEGALFMSNPLGFGYEDAALGMPVRLAWLACEDSGGSFQLPVFERG